MECASSELDLFLTPSLNAQQQSGYCVGYQPVSTISDTGPIEFSVPGSGEEYVDLPRTDLHVRYRIVKRDGSELPTEQNVTVANQGLHSLFSQLDVFVQDKLVTNSNNLYPYRCYFENLLNYGSDAKRSQLTAQMWYKDKAGKFDSYAENDGIQKRHSLTKGSKIVDAIGRPHADILHQPRYLLNNVNLKMRFSRSKNEFALVSNDAAPDAKIEILEATLYVRKVKISPRVILAQAAVLLKTPAKYPIDRCDLMSYAIPAGSMNNNNPSVYMGVLPSRIILGLVDSVGYNGSFARSPYNFQNFDLSYLALYADTQQIPFKPYRPDFENKQYIREYASLFQGLDKWGKDEGNEIDREEYPEGFTLYAFDLTADQRACSGQVSPIRQGNLRAELQFKKPLPSTVNVVIYGKFDSMLEIGNDRNVNIE